MSDVPRQTLHIWNERPLKMFHGTDLASAKDIVANGVDIALGRPRCDFGQGFYCTTQLPQAQEWAQIMAVRKSSLPALVCFTMPRKRIGDLLTLSFVLGTKAAVDFWSFVHACRMGRLAPEGTTYDVVFGPVAAAWQAMDIYENFDQVSFHTKTAESLLNNLGNGSILRI